MTWLAIGLQWLHVLGAIAWFGGALYSDFVVMPLLRDRADFVPEWAVASRRYFAPIAGLTILLGIGRGVANGVLSALATPYGITFVVSLVVGIALAALGGAGISRAAERATDAAGIARLRNLAWLELALFGVIFTLMIAMRFGY